MKFTETGQLVLEKYYRQKSYRRKDGSTDGKTDRLMHIQVERQTYTLTPLYPLN